MERIMRRRPQQQQPRQQLSPTSSLSSPYHHQHHQYDSKYCKASYDKSINYNSVDNYNHDENDDLLLQTLVSEFKTIQERTKEYEINSKIMDQKIRTLEKKVNVVKDKVIEILNKY